MVLGVATWAGSKPLPPVAYEERTVQGPRRPLRRVAGCRLWLALVPVSPPLQDVPLPPGARTASRGRRAGRAAGPGRGAATHASVSASTRPVVLMP